MKSPKKKMTKNSRTKKTTQKTQENLLTKVLVVFNKPLYQQLILEEKCPHYLKLLRAKAPVTKKWQSVYAEHQRSFEGISRTLQLLGLKADFLHRRELSLKLTKKINTYDLVITVGGDGTFLEASHFTYQTSLLGVNAAPSESTGALCAARLDNFLTLMVDLMAGTTQPIKIPRLKMTLGNKTLVQSALNEVLFANRSPGGTSRYLIKVGKIQEEHKSSGVWMATGVGSTAAIRSAGGKRLRPDFKGLQYQVRELLKLPSQKFTLQKGLLTQRQSIILTPTSRQMALFVDGNHLEVPVEYGEKVTVSSGGKPLSMIFV